MNPGMVWAVVKGDVVTSIGWFVVYFLGTLVIALWKQRRAKAAPRPRRFDNSWKGWQMRTRDRRRQRRRWRMRGR